MTLIQFRYFVGIVDAGLNMTVAAPRLRTTQSNLSKQLRVMEDELGFLLFTRRGRTFTGLTAAGQKVLAHARAVVEEMDNIRALAANLRHDHRGALHIATTHTQARYLLAEPLAALQGRFPQVAVHVAPGGDRESLARLARGEADLAILSGTQPPAADVALPLYRWERAIIVPPDHALAQLRRPLQLADLAGLPLISYESSREEASSLRRAFAAQGLAPNLAVTARDGDLIKAYVRAGMGVGVVAEMALGDEDDLCALPAAGLLPTCTSWLLLRRDRVLRDYEYWLMQRLMPHLSDADVRARLQQGVACLPEPGPVPTWRQRQAPAPRTPRLRAVQ